MKLVPTSVSQDSYVAKSVQGASLKGFVPPMTTDYLNRSVFFVPSLHEDIESFYIKSFAKHALKEVLKSCALKPSSFSKSTRDFDLVKLLPNAEFHRGVPVRDWYYRNIGNKSYSIYLDAKDSFALTYKGVPELVISYQQKGISIFKFDQLQIVHPYVQTVEGTAKRTMPRGLHKFDIAKLKVHLLEAFARYRGIENLLVISSKDNEAVKDPKSKFDERKAKELYDDLMSQAGYQRKRFELKEYWFKTLNH